MEEKDLVNKIVLLKNVKPNERWVVSCRARLAFRMEMGRKKTLLDKDIFALKEIFSFWKFYNPSRAFRAIYIAAVVFALVVSGGGLTVLAAMRSLPGSAFYPVKLGLERFKMAAMAAYGNDAVKLQSEMASRRLDELKQIMDAHDSADQKNAKVEQVVGQIQQQLTDLKNQLPDKDAGSPKSVAAAKIVGDKALQIEKALSEAKNSLSSGASQNLNSKINDAADAADKTGTQALEIIANGSHVNPADQQDTIAKVEAKINDIKARIKLISGELASNVFKASSNIEAILVIDQTVIKDQLSKASVLLDKATESLKQQDATGALKTFEAAKDMVSAAEKIMEIGPSGSGAVPSGSDPVKTATSSDSIQPLGGK